MHLWVQARGMVCAVQLREGGVRCPPMGWARQAAALLEVVISLSILLIAMSVVGLTFRNGERNVEVADHMTRAMMMTERMLAEADTGILKIDERTQSGYFGEEGPEGMSWRVEVNPHEEIKGLLDIDIYIYLGNPDASAEDHQLVLYTRVQRPEPKGIDFEKDFGFDQDQLQVVTDAMPGGAAAFDLTNFDPRMLASLDLDQIVELLPALVQMFGGSMTGSGQLDGILQAIQKGDMSSLQNLAQQAIDQSGAGKGSGAGGGSQGGKGSSGGGSGQTTKPPTGGGGGKGTQSPSNPSTKQGGQK
jgi:hypothetical protein